MEAQTRDGLFKVENFRYVIVKSTYQKRNDCQRIFELLQEEEKDGEKEKKKKKEKNGRKKEEEEEVVVLVVEVEVETVLSTALIVIVVVSLVYFVGAAEIVVVVVVVVVIGTGMEYEMVAVRGPHVKVSRSLQCDLVPVTGCLRGAPMTQRMIEVHSYSG
ncbi:hypothetical protein E2C01_045371 [Portunus trituberculatus]|uniref:Uncharacterized protein n=1 Tax=Portunus trituberculatus TaxID=210409 RepID=A0A5B7G2P2_PORTR|nr:hypothetical protein [Portunus trituberculatus]